MKKKLLIQESYKIQFLNLTNSDVVTDFLQIINSNYAPNTVWEIDIQKGITMFPNALTPISALMDYYTKNYDVRFSFATERSKIAFATNDVEGEFNTNKTVLNKVWHFKSADEIYDILVAFIDDLQKQDAFAPDVLNSLEWSLYEIMDNVLFHSGMDNGYIMGQVHKKSQHVAFCICDTGMGIYNSLKDSVHAPQSPQDALRIAVQEGITRDKKIGQGNGMFGLHEIVRHNKGRLEVHSNGAVYTLINDKITVHNGRAVISAERGCTIIDFQLDYQNAVSIRDVFPNSWSANNVRLEKLENEEGDMLYTLKEKRYGYGTRVAGEIVRNEVINYYNSTKNSVLIDFSDINIISSSFADEFIGKLVIHFGFLNFNHLIKLRNMNDTVAGLIQRAVTQRLAESFNN